jgi:primosomal protein N' (replication factor Y)
MNVEVAVPVPLFKTFTYEVSGPLPDPGTRVLVPFRRGEEVGWVLGPTRGPAPASVRKVLGRLDEVPSLPPDLLALGQWISEYYVSPLGVTLRSMLPAALSDAGSGLLCLTPEGEDAARAQTGSGLSPRSVRVLHELGTAGGGAPIPALRRALGRGSFWPEIEALSSARLVERRSLPPSSPARSRHVARIREWITDLASREAVFTGARRQRECYERIEAAGGAVEVARLGKEHGFSPSVIQGLARKGVITVGKEEVFRDPFEGIPRERPDDHALSPAQAQAVEALRSATRDPRGTPFLLHGVTGSGKTLVYVHLLREVVESQGRGAIVLVPEISLTPQTVARFRAWFGDRVAVLHSGLSDGERYDQWRQIRSGAKSVVVGARSAVFAPLPDLGAIVVDEEHDGSYKQSETPRYHARDVAVVRAGLTGSLCVLGSATPSLESWQNAELRKFRRLELPSRVPGSSMPSVEVVDLRALRKGAGGNETSGRAGRSTAPADVRADGILSPRLVTAVRSRLQKGEQCILLLNRRGYASFIQCRACGSVRECPNCSVSFTYHRATSRLLCHHCRHEEGVPRRCDACGSDDLSYRGVGTQQVERVVAETFPGARIARMDVDTTSGKWAHQEILGRVERGEIDLLLGTQMIAKGLDFPRVTLVGVVNADVGLHLPDFRASERTFQLLSQVSGRAGRGAAAGEVVIQTSLPEHYAIQSAVAHDFRAFVQRELEERRSPPYPPNVRLVNVIVSSPNARLAAEAVESAAGWMRRRLRGTGGAPEVVGPAPSPIERLHSRWRWHFFLRGGKVAAVTPLLRSILEDFRPPPGDVRISVDRDPVALL